jgi:hypothetical protein
MSLQPWRGINVATALPFNNDLSVDYDAFAEYVRWLAENGMDSVVPNGSLGVGEYQILTDESVPASSRSLLRRRPRASVSWRALRHTGPRRRAGGSSRLLPRAPSRCCCFRPTHSAPTGRPWLSTTARPRPSGCRSRPTTTH